MLREFRCDLHVHSCLSPCADLDMYPRALIENSIAARLDMIAICDHNASENVPYVLKAAERTALTVIPGMEAASSEEVHVLALFETLGGLREFQKIVYRHLAGKNEEKVFGPQVIVNESDEVEGYNERLLIGATSLSLRELIDGIHSLQGLVIASHIDRESFSVIGQLGFIDPSMPFDALEVSASLGIAAARIRFPELSGFPLLTSSDAHFPADIGKAVTVMHLERASFVELRKALRREDGRRIEE